MLSSLIYLPYSKQDIFETRIKESNCKPLKRQLQRGHSSHARWLLNRFDHFQRSFSRCGTEKKVVDCCSEGGELAFTLNYSYHFSVFNRGFHREFRRRFEIVRRNSLGDCSGILLVNVLKRDRCFQSFLPSTVCQPVR